MKYFTENRYTSSVIILSVITAFLGNVLEPLVIYLLSWAILIYFMLEACFKLRKLGWKGYIGHAGNRFDFLVVLCSILFVIIPNMAVGSIVYLRLFRVLSLVKIVKLIPDAGHILSGLARVMKASRAILTLLAIQLVFFSLLGFSLFGTYLPNYFGNPLSAMNTIFTIFTVENWGAVPTAAAALDEPFIYYAVNAFVICVLILGGFISLSLANAIFVDEMASDNNDEIMKKMDLLMAENAEIKKVLIHLEKQIGKS